MRRSISEIKINGKPFEEILKSNSNLGHVDLSYVDLSGVDLGGVDLGYADLYHADLSNANLRNANLRHADLSHANLYHANLACANLSYADLNHVILNNANLRNAYLINTNLLDADLGDANLNGAFLRGANLDYAHLDYTNNIPFIPYICPDFGAFIGFKKAKHYIVVLEIPEDAKRLSAATRKCRCDKAKVLAIQNIDGTKADVDTVTSDYDSAFTYRVGKTVSVDNFDENRWNECSTGIHFFINRQEAVEY